MAGLERSRLVYLGARAGTRTAGVVMRARVFRSDRRQPRRPPHGQPASRRKGGGEGPFGRLNGPQAARTQARPTARPCFDRLWLQIRSNLIIITNPCPAHGATRGIQMAIEFYDVKLREKVQIPESEVKKTTYERPGKDGKINVRYAFRAVNNGTKLTKFASKEDWDALDAPIE
jgi:hypothetical protein